MNISKRLAPQLTQTAWRSIKAKELPAFSVVPLQLEDSDQNPGKSSTGHFTWKQDGLLKSLQGHTRRSVLGGRKAPKQDLIGGKGAEHRPRLGSSSDEAPSRKPSRPSDFGKTKKKRRRKRSMAPMPWTWQLKPDPSLRGRDETRRETTNNASTDRHHIPDFVRKPSPSDGNNAKKPSYRKVLRDLGVEAWPKEIWAQEDWKDNLTPQVSDTPASTNLESPDSPIPNSPQPSPKQTSQRKMTSKTPLRDTSSVQTIRLPRIRTTLPSPIPVHRVRGALRQIERPTLSDVATDYERPPIAVLSHGLDRVLFNPGVHWLQDPRSRVYNFAPWLQTVPKVSDFDFDRIPSFVPSSRDTSLRSLAEKENRRFAGSTSSLSGILSQCYFLISGNKEVDTSVLSGEFRNLGKKFTPAQRWPASVILNYKTGVYTVDPDKAGIDDTGKNILVWLGTLLEKFLTVPQDNFANLLKSTPMAPDAISTLQGEKEAYRYSKSKDFIMRSQLDCYDARLPGTGVFDIKTRACVPTRLDILNYEEHQGYTIKTQYGALESFEKEYYDLIRSAFLKYSFQVRIGNMDGVIVAYHNTETIFGFQYIPLLEMDARVFGPGEGVGERVFEKCVGLMEQIMIEVTNCFGNQSCKATFLTPEEGSPRMDVWVEPLEWNGDEELKPIEHLAVKVTSYLDDVPVPKSSAVSNTDPSKPWTLEYDIERLEVKPEEARKNLALAREDAIRKTYSIPSGVDLENLEEYWRSVAHGNATEAGSSDAAAFDPSMFQEPRGLIRHLRDLSRKGREETELLQQKYKDAPKVVLGE